MNSFREDIISRIEAQAQLLRATGMCEAWFAGADPAVVSVQHLRLSRHSNSFAHTYLFAQVAGEVNGALLELLAEKIGYHDKECVNLFRRGAPLVKCFSVQSPSCVALRVLHVRWMCSHQGGTVCQ